MYLFCRFSLLVFPLVDLHFSYLGPEGAAYLGQSHTPQQELVKIWALSDQDGDGKLDVNEFCVAMHLTTLYCQGHQLPSTVPDALIIKGITHAIPSLDSRLAWGAQPVHTPSNPFGTQSPFMTNTSQPSPFASPQASPFGTPTTSSPFMTNTGLGQKSSPFMTNTNAGSSAAIVNPFATNVNNRASVILPQQAPVVCFLSSLLLSHVQDPWAVSGQEAAKYEALFTQSGPSLSGHIETQTAITLFQQTGLTQEQLAKVWYDSLLCLIVIFCSYLQGAF
jgi:hypothetical protein